MIVQSSLEEEVKFQLEKWGGYFRQRDEVSKSTSRHRACLRDSGKLFRWKHTALGDRALPGDEG